MILELRNIRALLKLIVSPLLWTIYFLSGLVPRSREIVILASHTKTFADNSKYAYLAFQQRKEHFRHIVWIARDQQVVEFLRGRGGEAHLQKSLLGVWYCLRAKFWIVSGYLSDANFYLSRGAVYINTWHGSALKNIEFDICDGPLATRYQAPTWLDRFVKSPQIYVRPSVLLSASPEVSRVFSRAFRIDQTRCREFGYPRNDCLSATGSFASEKWQKESLISLIEDLKAYRRVWIYMPTFRDHNPRFLSTCGLDFSQLNASLADGNDLLLLKLHQATPSDVLADFERFSNIKIVDNGEDVYPLLPYTHGLITDYSSIYLDYLLLDKPIIFYAFDLAEYLSAARGMYYPYGEMTPGPVVSDGAELIAYVASCSVDLHVADRARLRSLFFTRPSGGAGAELVSMVLEMRRRPYFQRSEIP